MDIAGRVCVFVTEDGGEVYVSFVGWGKCVAFSCVILASKLVFTLEIHVPNISQLSTKTKKVNASYISFLLYQYTCKFLVCY